MPKVWSSCFASCSTFSRLVSMCQPPMTSRFQSTSRSTDWGELDRLGRGRLGDKVLARWGGKGGGSCLARGGAEGLLWWKISCTFWARSVIWSSSFSSWGGALASFSRCWIRSLMDEMSSRLTASWAVCWSTVSVIVFCCACIRSSFWPMLLSILCRACVSWAKWCASGGPDASRAGSSRPSPRTFLRGGKQRG